MDQIPTDKKIEEYLQDKYQQEYNVDYDRLLFELDGKQKAKASSLSQRINLKETKTKFHICEHCDTVQQGFKKGYTCKFCHEFTKAKEVK